jgi:hypothetical protein
MLILVRSYFENKVFMINTELFRYKRLVLRYHTVQEKFIGI